MTVASGCFISPICLHVGDNTWLGVNNFICGKVTIGKNVALGPGVIIPGASHDTSLLINSAMGASLNVIGTVIEDDAWIGGNACILDGVTVGRGAVVGAGAVVTKNIPPYAVAMGNPARVVRGRDCLTKFD